MAFSPPKFSSIGKKSKKKSSKTDLRKLFLEATAYSFLNKTDFFIEQLLMLKYSITNQKFSIKIKKIAFSEECVVKRRVGLAHEKCYSTLFHYLILL